MNFEFNFEINSKSNETYFGMFFLYPLDKCQLRYFSCLKMNQIIILESYNYCSLSPRVTFNYDVSAFLVKSKKTEKVKKHLRIQTWLHKRSIHIS